MIKTITPKDYKRLEEIGFEKDEISAIEIIHELKSWKYPIDINELINKTVSEKIRDELLYKIEEMSWEMGTRTFARREELYDR